MHSKKNKKYTISACVIVKNEEKNLPTWLKSMNYMADELVVVDTGSDDRTKEITAAAGARLFDFPWCGDFAKAKNHALEQAKGDWILFFDADEYLTEQDAQTLLKILDRRHAEKELSGFICRNISIDPDQGNKFLDETLSVRIFKNRPDTRFVGQIHETLQNISKEKQNIEFLSDIKIYHTGYAAAVVEKKFKRNLEILKKSADENHDEDKNCLYFADCYYGLKDFEKSLEYARRAAEGPYKMLGLANRPYVIWIQSMFMLNKSNEEIREVVEKALKKYPDQGEFHFMKGVLAIRDRDWLNAESSFRRGLAIVEDIRVHGKKNVECGLEAMNMLAGVYLKLANIVKMKGNKAEAMELCTKGIQEHRYEAGILRLLGLCVSDLDDVDVIQLINSLYDKEADGAFIVGELFNTPLHRVCLYYDRLSGGKNLDDYRRYFLAGQHRAAARLTADQVTAISLAGSLVAEQMGIAGNGALDTLLAPNYKKAKGKDYPLESDNSRTGDIIRTLARLKKSF